MDVYVLIASVVFALLFAQAAWHKIAQHQQFQAVLSDYRVLPAWLVKPAAYCLASVEAGVAVMWATQTRLQVAAIVTVGLLCAYCLAVGVNLLRGRSHISCGCGVGTEQPLSIGIIIRNGLLAALSLAGFAGTPTGDVTWVDYGLVAAASIAIGAAFAASSALMRTTALNRSWIDRG